MSQSKTALHKALPEIRKILLFVGLFSLFINLLMLVGPLYMLQVYDRVLSSGSLETLLYLTLAAVGLIGISAVLEAVRSRVLVRLAGRFDELLNQEMFDRMHRSALGGRAKGTQPLRDLEAIRNFMTGAGLFFFFDAPWTPIFLAFVYLLHPMMFTVALGGAILLFAIALASEMFTRTLLMNASGHNAKAIAFAGHTLANADTVEAMGMLSGLKQRWLALHDSGLELQAQASDRAGVLTAMTKFIRPVLQIAILGVGAYLVLAQEILPGAMIAGSIMMGRALAPVEGAIGNWRTFVMARSALQRVMAELSEPAPKISEVNLPRPTGVLSVEKLVAAAPGGQVPIIKGISFATEAGQVIGIVGPSAAGKSTLARLLVGVWAPASGHVRLDGAEVSTWNHAELGAHIGYLSQDVDLFEGTVSQNISRFGETDSNSVIAAAKRAGVHDVILRLPDGYDTRIGVEGMVLSGGQRQRIGLARAIYGNPAFVVLDEPNSNLDQQGELALQATIRDLRQHGTSVVVVAHRSALVKIADMILVLNEGKIDHFGPRDDVLAALAPAPKHKVATPVHTQENPVRKQLDLVSSGLRSA